VAMPLGRTKLSVLQVVTDDDRRGAQVFAVDLHNALVARGYGVRTVALARGAVGGLDVDVIGPTRMHLATLRRLRGLIDESDVVVGHGSTTLPACALAGLGSRVPFVYRQISDSLYWANTSLRRLQVRWSLRRASRVVALWQGAADVLTDHFGVAAERIDCIANGVPVTRFPAATERCVKQARIALGIDQNGPVVAYVGALVHEKGVDIAIDAIGRLPHATLLIVGDGSDRSSLERQAAAGSGRVRFVGALRDARGAYQAADVVVLPSRGGDSMPAVLIEAGLTGVPTVSTPVAAIPEIVANGRTGTLVESGDPDATAAAVQAILADNQWRRSLGRCARERCVERFSIDTVANAWSRTLARALDIHGTLGAQVVSSAGQSAEAADEGWKE
jgi:glycosyltransferase involved in cell wall biosynthesis